MSTKYFLFICATFLIIQNCYAEDHINREQLTENVTKFYIEMLDQAIASLKTIYEPIINEMENNYSTTELMDQAIASIQTEPNNNEMETNMDTIVREYALKLTQLKLILQIAVKLPSSTLDNLKLYKNDMFTDITSKVMEIEDYVKDKPKLAEQMIKLSKARQDIGKVSQQSIEEFANEIVAEVEKYWNSLTTVEQHEKQKLRDTVDEVKVATTPSSKFKLLNKIFIFRNDIKQKAIKW